MTPFATHDVAAVFAAYPPPVRAKLKALRELIFRTAAHTERAGRLEETLKWGQASYLTRNPATGTTIRIDAITGRPCEYALYVHCQTTLIDTFRTRFGNELRYEGNRAVVFSVDEEVPVEILRTCIALALTYRLKNRPPDGPGRTVGSKPA